MVDVFLLRNALRLVHCIQLERGSSLYFCADEKTFEQAMLKARSASDNALKYTLYKNLSIASSLTRIRNLVDSHKDSDDELIFHRIFKCFNVITSTIIRDCIIPLVPGKYHKSIVKRTNRKKTLSMDLTDKLCQKIGSTPEPSLRKVDSYASFGAADQSPSVEAAEEQVNHDPSVRPLLNLLNIFVQMKESAGIERAILSTTLVMRSNDPNSLRMMLNDLVLHVENQRSLTQKLAQLPPGNHRNLVLELSHLSPRLKELQTLILNDFDAFQQQNYEIGSIWDLLTEYIDKLHSVELLIVEDLEISLPYSFASNNTNSLFPPLIPPQRQQELQLASSNESDLLNTLRQVFSQSGSPDNLASMVESLPAEVVKESILAALGGGGAMSENNSMSCVPNSKTSQGSGKARLQEKLQKALSREKSKEWDISIYEINFDKRIGVGASATTYLADWSGQKVAVKVASITEFGLEGWRREVAALQRLHHPNVIRLMGSIEHQEPLTYCLVLEYCNAGDLNTALKYATPRNFFFHVLISIANAMAYLHARRIIHRDLKPANILCHGNVASGNFTVKVTDFGVAAEGNLSDPASEGLAPERNLTGETGTYRWMAPEVIRHEPYSTMADVYSFAVMVWQLLTHDEPFMDVDATEAARLVALEGVRPPLPNGTPESIANLVTVNWSDNPGDRWKFEKVAESLEEIRTCVTADEKKWLDAERGHPIYVHDVSEVNEAISRSAPKPKEKEKRRASALLGSFFGVQKKALKS